MDADCSSLWLSSLVFLRVQLSPAPENVRVSLHDGLVSVEAKDAPLREILEAWARVGDIAFVNADLRHDRPQSPSISSTFRKKKPWPCCSAPWAAISPCRDRTPAYERIALRSCCDSPAERRRSRTQPSGWCRSEPTLPATAPGNLQ